MPYEYTYEHGFFDRLREIAWIDSLFTDLRPAFEQISNAWAVFTEGVRSAWEFTFSLPQPIPILLYIVMFSACAAILIAHVAPIFNNRGDWLKHPEHNLMYSYFTKTGLHQLKCNYPIAHQILREPLWKLPEDGEYKPALLSLSNIPQSIREHIWKISIANWAYVLGNITFTSKLLAVLVSIAYIPVAVLGFIEIVLRIVIGTAYLFVARLIHRLLLFITKLITYLLLPLFKLADKMAQKRQYCPTCYERFALPVFCCKECSAHMHDCLVPSSCGLIFAKCDCNKKFLPTTVFTGRSRLIRHCPVCHEELAAANARQAFVQLIGAENAGKTAYLSAFQYVYQQRVRSCEKTFILNTSPRQAFSALEGIYQGGDVGTHSEIQAYNFLCSYRKPQNPARYNLLVYDIPGRQIAESTYEKQPRHFAFCQGFVLLVDPLNTQLSDSTLNQFILQFREECDISATAMSDAPVAVVISKTDIPAVRQELDRMLAKEDEASGNDEYATRHSLLKRYLEKIGHENIVLNLEATFKNINYFTASSMKNANTANPNHETEILAPMEWLATKARSLALQRMFVQARPGKKANVFASIMGVAGSIAEKIRFAIEKRLRR